MIEVFLQAAPTATARDIEHQHRGHIQYVAVDDPSVVLNVNTPEDYATLCPRNPTRVRRNCAFLSRARYRRYMDAADAKTHQSTAKTFSNPSCACNHASLPSTVMARSGLATRAKPSLIGNFDMASSPRNSAIHACPLRTNTSGQSQRGRHVRRNGHHASRPALNPACCRLPSNFSTIRFPARFSRRCSNSSATCSKPAANSGPSRRPTNGSFARG